MRPVLTALRKQYTPLVSGRASPCGVNLHLLGSYMLVIAARVHRGQQRAREVSPHTAVVDGACRWALTRGRFRSSIMRRGGGTEIRRA
jgi:hypothetical protein